MLKYLKYESEQNWNLQMSGNMDIWLPQAVFDSTPEEAYKRRRWIASH